MAFGAKYRHEFYDYFSNQWRVDFLQDGYSGSVTEVDGGATPCVINYVGGAGGDISSPMIGSEAVVSLISSTDEQFSEIWTGKLKDWQCRIYKYDSGYQLYWAGWIDTHNYTEPYIYIPYESVFHCTDGIGLLKDVDYPIEPNLFFFGMIYSGYYATNQYTKLIHYIATALKQTGFDLDIHVAVDLFHDFMISDRILEDTNMDYLTFTRSGTRGISCYDVLETILKPLHCRVFMDAGHWVVERIPYKSHATIDYIVYNSDGEYSSTLSAQDKTVSLTSSTGSPLCVWEDQTQMLEIEPAWRDVNVKLAGEGRGNILQNAALDGTFSDYDYNTDDSLRYYTYFGGIKTGRGQDYFTILGGWAGVPRSTGLRTSTGSIYGTTTNPIGVNIAPKSGYHNRFLKFKVTLDIEPISRDPVFLGSGGKTGKFYFELRVQIDNTYYTNSQPFWTSDPRDNVMVVTSVFPPGTNFLTNANLRYYQAGYWHDVDEYSYPGITPDNDSLYVSTEFPRKTYTLETVDPIYINDYNYDTKVTGPMTAYLKLRGHKFDDDSLSSDVKVYAVKLEVLSYNVDDNYEKLITDVIDDDYAVDSGEISYKLGESLSVGSNELYAKYNYLAYDTTNARYVYIQDWGEDTDLPDLNLLSGLTKNYLKAQYGTPRRILRGDLIVDDMTYSSVLEDSSGRKFLPLGYEYDVKFGTRSTEWLELYETETADGGAFDEEAFSTAFDI